MNGTSSLSAEKLEIPSPPTFRLDGKRALVTGASRGLGFAAAVALASAGAKVVVVARNKKIHEVAMAIDRKAKAHDWKGSCDSQTIDVTDWDAMKSLVAKGIDGQAFDVLVSNAGTNKPEPAVDVAPHTYEKIMDLNVKAGFFLSTEMAKRLLAEKLSGSIIHMSSQMGHVGSKNRSLYCASKHAVQGFVKAMAWEWGGAGIRVNALCPTFIRTPLTSAMFADKTFLDEVIANIALQRVGEIDEIMGAVVFLASDASSLITGSSLMLDGGWTAR